MKTGNTSSQGRHGGLRTVTPEGYTFSTRRSPYIYVLSRTDREKDHCQYYLFFSTTPYPVPLPLYCRGSPAQLPLPRWAFDVASRGL
ncbi:hypothetical protein PCASD_07289 [Puccinia coronata f. sp. avenae]|uniref:Uncharacterized protein n=1 Tax=Puccinia coronata f. sp. avenae TaxID=200324 RepID=A0A2N5URI2_9BASI|nr:hypothetical protein PCASD_07289 [Puccinia coronata f. sp. avenae]